MASFLRRWEQHEAGPSLAPKTSARGNVNVTGAAGDPLAYAFVPADPAFERAIEPRILPLVQALIDRLGVVTYSSCEGHAGAAGASLHPAHVGIIPRCPLEAERVAAALESCAEHIRAKRTAPHIEVRVQRRALESEHGERPCLDLWFLSTDADEGAYFSALPATLSGFLQALPAPCSEPTKMSSSTQPIGQSPQDSQASACADTPETWRVFAAPFLTTPAGQATLERARMRRATRVTGEFLARFGQQLAPDLSAVVARLPDYVGSRRREVHRALTALGSATYSVAAPTTAGLRAALWLSTAGVPIDVDVKLASPARLVWHGHVLPRCDWVGSSSGAPGRLEYGLGARKASVEVADLSQDSRAIGLPGLHPASRGATPVHVLLPWTMDACPVLCTSFEPTPLETSHVLDSLQAAFQLLRRSREYASWCDGSLTDLVPVRGNVTQSMSSSRPEAPGQLAVSLPAHPTMLGELLVHESSHEMFHLANEIEAADDGSDTELYWSPVRKMGRPIDRILLAHHAFINILLYFRRVIDCGLDHDGYAAGNTIAHRRSVDELEVGLRATRALTAMGRALYLPVAEALA
jgi:HEXXH motif-containing protein